MIIALDVLLSISILVPVAVVIVELSALIGGRRVNKR
jgi:hypothetical protein